MKGISPLIASVLLIAFTVSVALIIFSWGMTFTKQTTSNVTLTALSSVQCSGASISIQNLFLSNNSTTAVISNEGSIDLDSIVSVIASNGTIFSSGITQLEKGGIKTITFNSSVSCATFSKAIATTGCQGVERTVTKKNLIKYEGVDCSLCDTIDNGLVLNTSMNEGNGGTVHDYSVYANNGSCFNISGAKSCSWAAGKYNFGVAFDGSSDYVEVTGSSSLQPSVITLEAWVKSSLDGRYIIAKVPDE